MAGFPKLIGLLGVVLCCLSGVAQRSVPMTISSKEFPVRFPVQEAYDFELDTSNYLYMAAPSGVFRFNGYEVASIQLPKDYKNTVIHALFTDAHQRIWIEAKNSGLGWIQGDSVVRYPHMAAIDSLMPYRLEAAYQDLDDQLHIAPRGIGYYAVSNEGKVKRVMGVDSGVHGFVITRLADGTPFHFSVLDRDKFAAKANLSVYYWDQQQAPKALVELKISRPYFHSSLAQQTDGSLTLSTGTEDLVTIRSDTLVDYHRLSHMVFHLFADKDTNLWIGTYRGGILRVKGQDYAQAERLLPGHVGAAVAQDQNGGIWCQSTAAIFHYIPDWRIKQFAVTEASTAQEQVTSITEGNGAVYCNYDEGKLLVVAEDSLSTVVIPERFVDRDLPKISYDQVRDWVWLSFAHTALAYDGDAWIPSVIPDSVIARMGNLIDLLVLNDGAVLGLTKKGLIQVHPERPMQVYPSTNAYSFQCFTQDDAGRVWIGSGSGIWAWDGESYQQPIPEDTSSKAPSSNVIQIGFSAGRLWINTLKNGLFVYKQNAWYPILDNEGKHVYVSDFSLGRERGLWGRTLEKHPRVVRVKPYREKEVVDYFGNQLFFSPEKVSSHDAFHVIQNHIFHGLRGSMDVIPVNTLQADRIPPKLLLKSVHVNHHEVPVKAHYQMPFDSNSFYFIIDRISYRLFDFKFRYRLIGWQDEYQVSDLKEIQYTNLAPGDYEFHFETQAAGEPWFAGEPVRITIAAPYWQQWWFIASMLLLLIAGIGAGFYFWYRQKHNKTMLLLDKVRAEQTALKAQMNPHFVFNALSSIQELVFSENKLSAVNNIAMFARLMRKVLEQSSMHVISLQEEIETLDLYLQLEALRFDGQFDFAINTSPEINTEKQQIPPLLLQPHIENAIKHGLLNKKPRAGKLMVSFQRNGTILHCVVEDDGIGRKQAATIRQNRTPSHQSFGAEATKLRIKHLNQGRAAAIQLSIVDLTDSNGEPNGTRVTMLIPDSVLK